MGTPKYTITAVDTEHGSWNYDTALPKKDRNPSWCVAFVRFKTPGAMFIEPKEDTMAEKPLLVVENDCVSVSVSNQKSSLGKMCDITMKIGEIYYQNAVAPGDWVFVWMANYQDDIENILNQLLKGGGVPQYPTSNSTAQSVGMNTWQSGLKFIGRVMSISGTDSISSGGQRMLTQTISCQAFVELATSVYYTFVSQPIVTAEGTLTQQAAAENFYTKEISFISQDKTIAQPTSMPTEGVSSGLENALTNLSKAFLNFYRTIDGKEQIQSTSPEAIIGLLFVLLMGVDTQSNFLNSQSNGAISKAIPGAQGTFSDAIAIPKSVANILGSRASKLWQIYNLYLGLQKYQSIGAAKVWQNFSPSNFTAQTAVQGSNIYRTDTRCKGFVPFLVPPIWENNSYWNIFSQFLNPVANEMYTALRINRDGRILPALIIREKPFSTKLFDLLYKTSPQLVLTTNQGNTESSAIASIRKSLSNQNSDAAKTFGKNYDSLSSIAPETAIRTMYSNIPRWIIDDSVIKSINVAPSEERRINFVQVWGRSVGLEINNLNVSQEILKIAQFAAPNYVADTKDIHRHGLRADITETNYDVVSNDLGTITPILCRQRADWLFNGHLKLYGTVTLQGVQEPIVEGDNCQIRGVLFHIEAVTHSGSLASNGTKSFTTTLTISNGIVAASLDSSSGIPTYAVGNIELEYTNENVTSQKLPGFTDIENTGARKKRNPSGDYKE